MGINIKCNDFLVIDAKRYSLYEALSCRYNVLCKKSVYLSVITVKKINAICIFHIILKLVYCKCFALHRSESEK